MTERKDYKSSYLIHQVYQVYQKLYFMHNAQAEIILFLKDSLTDNFNNACTVLYLQSIVHNLNLPKSKLYYHWI